MPDDIDARPFDALRYIVFSGKRYYPDGGADDLHSSHLELDGAINEAKKEAEGEKHTGSIGEFVIDKWSHVFDLQDMKIVWKSEEEY
jgi:hypothetical protein